MKTKPSFSRFLLIFSTTLLLLLVTACNKGETVGELTFDNVVSVGGTVENPSVYEVVDTVPAATPQQVIDDEIWSCKDFQVDISQNAEDFVLYSSGNAEIIYPGNFLQGNSVSEGAPKIIPLKRGTGTITINTLNGSSVVTKTVPEVSYSSIAQATNDLIGSNNGNLTANISYTREEVRSLEELGVKMNAKYSSLTTKVKGSFNYNSSQTFNSIFVKVTQSLYSIVYDIPNPETAFDPNVKPEDLQKYVFKGNPATYISSVNYGRIFYLLIQSTQSTEEIKAAVEASFNGGLVSGGGGIKVDNVSELDQVSVSGYAYGGDAGLAAGALIGDMDDVKTFIEQGGAINNGAPISYVVRSLEDPSIVVAANLATQYTVSECENITGGLPTFTDARQSVGAACFVVGNVSSKMSLFDGISNEYVNVNAQSVITGPYGIWQWGNDNTHPFRNSGVGSALNVRTDNDPKKTYFFSKDGTKFCVYTPANLTFSPVYDLWQWGTDYSCPFTAVGAAMDVSVGTREISCLFNFEGTMYTLYESGQFSTPRSIKDLQVRDRDEPLEIPFESVRAGMRLHITHADGSESGRVVLAIFDGAGKKYVYYDMDKNVIVGPLDI
ncbi:MAG: thiol-activated cytolysin family protein [Bacteroidia bacterium]|nr:thiol-activated cytolysin family protein [Bacteroidia bacterium]